MRSSVKILPVVMFLAAVGSAGGEPPCFLLGIDLDPQKDVYLDGEPIRLEGEIRNESNESVFIDTGLRGRTPSDEHPGKVAVTSLVVALRAPGEEWVEVRPPRPVDGITVGGPGDLEAGASIPFSFWLFELFSVAEVGHHQVRVTMDRESSYSKRSLGCDGDQPVGEADFVIIEGAPHELRSVLEELVESALNGGEDEQLRAVSALRRERSPDAIELVVRLYREAQNSRVRRAAGRALATEPSIGSVEALAELGCEAKSKWEVLEILEAFRAIAYSADTEIVRRRAEIASKLEHCN